MKKTEEARTSLDQYAVTPRTITQKDLRKMSTKTLTPEAALAHETLHLTKRPGQFWQRLHERKAIETLLLIMCHEVIINENPPKSYIPEKYAAHLKQAAAELTRMGSAEFYLLSYMYDTTGKAPIQTKHESSSLLRRAEKLLGKNERNVTIEYRLTVVFSLLQTYADAGLPMAEVPV